MERLIGTKEAEKITGLNQRTIQRMAQRREIPSVFLAGAWRFRPSELHAWIAGEFERQAPRKKGKRALRPQATGGGLQPHEW